MSYIPDYRKETDKLNDIDKAFIKGYRMAMQSADDFFDNIDLYDPTEEEKKILSNTEADSVRECFKDWMEDNEIDAVCSLFDKEEYFDIELTDANPPMYTGTKGAKAND